MSPDQTTAPDALSRGSWPEWRRIQDLLRTESVGGILLLAATLLAVVLANSPWSEAYFAVRDTHFGSDIGPLHLDLSIGHWAADGLLAVFFFMAGLELKREFVAGDLRDPRRALLPVVAAFCGAAVPAAFYLLVAARGGAEAMRGWAIPSATDIAFALAVLAVIGSHLPSALRTFLLTLAIVDDLIAIVVIAVFYTSDLQPLYLLLFLLPVAVYAVLARRGQRWFRQHAWGAWVILLPIGVVAWALLLNSGVHATIAGVVLGFTVPVLATDRADGGGPLPADHDPSYHGLAHQLEHRIRPLSAAVCVPIFAFFSAGVAIGGWSGLVSALQEPVALGVLVGLVLGKIVGIAGGTFLITRIRGVDLDPDIAWIDLIGLGALGGIGFTVSLLVAELSFPSGSTNGDVAKIGILLASVGAALLASAILSPRNAHYRAVAAAERVDTDADGVPDLFQDHTSSR
ncbi:sodium/proton antiporter, NhaA family [Raineyella antarctica]|uniref:Na(+)/H(+) antiporter NhaA n=1 Tax=Raineyella antarctica TaxID=1577474 RepID=A0A1G6GDG0_9ACTN|nr:Na+/H+ antiporter NhaA [Raineyella antarctica]SDB80038.1 sodium/proton antiporter, NhaA family [Raineyella antarctica]